jgi:hypothetical protein
MSDNCSVIFRGDIVLGKNLVDVKKKLAQLFKVDEARIERMFTGKPVPLKANIPLVQAKKYQDVLNQVGIVTVIVDSSIADTKAQNPTKPSTNKTEINKLASAERVPKPATPVAATDTSSSSPAQVAQSTAFTIAPAGSDLIDDNKQASPAPVDTAHISLSPQEGNIIKDDERLAPLPASIDLDSLDWDIAEVGEILLKESERAHLEPLNIDTDDLSLSDVGGNLIKESERAKVESVNIDTDDLSLSDEGGNLINEDERRPLKEVDVDISHIKLARHNPFM